MQLAVAFIAAALALVGHIFYDQWKRHHERRAIAGALAGELGAYIELLQPAVSPKHFRTIADPRISREARQRGLRSMAPPPNSHPVFDKVADKIGLLDVRDAVEVSEVYNVVTGMRLHIANLSTDAFLAAPDEGHIALLNIIASAIEKYAGEGGKAVVLVDRLMAVSRERFRCTVSWPRFHFVP